MTCRNLTLTSLLGIAALALSATAEAASAATHNIDVSAQMAAFEQRALTLQLAPNAPALKFTLAELMAALNVPGLSIAVIDNYQIAWAKGYGVTAAGGQSPVAVNTLFQAASISKAVTAAAALALVERGQLTLDGNVNQQLKSWQVPDNEFTVTEKVSLRRLLSHTAGLSVHGFAGYAAGTPRPTTLLQILDGQAPANNAPVRVVMVPGSKKQYSGGGITVEQLLLTEVSDQQFAELMHETVLDKLGMTFSFFFEQGLTAEHAARSASGHAGPGQAVPGGAHIYPELAAAGLWTTPTDLATFAIEIAQSRKGRSKQILSKAMAIEMLTPEPQHDGLLGFQAEPGEFGLFKHGGGSHGFKALLVMNWVTGKGLVAMSNADAGAQLNDLLLQRIASLYGWSSGALNPPPALGLVALLGGADAALKQFERSKASGTPPQESGLNEAGYALLGAGKPKDAVRLLRRNVQEFPASGNVYDSLAEALEASGDKAGAIENYQTALQIAPDNKNAEAQMARLGGVRIKP